MTRWYESLSANIGLRAGGMALLGSGGVVAIRLNQMAPSVSAREPTSLMLLLAAILFLCGSAGSALIIAGPALWERVEVSDRWRRLPPPDLGAAAGPDRDV